jgi:hypothetical protein
MSNIDGKIILTRYDGIFEFDVENFIKSKIEYKDIFLYIEKN